MATKKKIAEVAEEVKAVAAEAEAKVAVPGVG